MLVRLISTVQWGYVAQSSCSDITLLRIPITLYPSAAVKASLRLNVSVEEMAWTSTIPARSERGGNGGRLGGGIAGGGLSSKVPQSLQS